MQKRITLDEAATKLGLFYTELMDVLNEVVIEYPDPVHDYVALERLDDVDKSPNTTIDYEAFVQIQEHLKIEVLPERDPTQGFNAKLFDRRKKYDERLEKWTHEWEIQNKSRYEAIFNSWEGYLKKRGLIVPTSCEEMFQWLGNYYTNRVKRRPECYLTKDFSELYFGQFHEAKKKILSPNGAQKEKITNEHWALFYIYLLHTEEVVEGKNTRNTCIDFFAGIGRKANDIYGKLGPYRVPKERKEKFRTMGKSGKAFIKTVKSMLTDYKFKKAEKYAQSEIDAVLGKQ